jgi:hypothetical protein
MILGYIGCYFKATPGFKQPELSKLWEAYTPVIRTHQAASYDNAGLNGGYNSNEGNPSVTMGLFLCILNLYLQVRRKTTTVSMWMHKFKIGHESIKDACNSGKKRSMFTDKKSWSQALSLTKMPGLH